MTLSPPGATHPYSFPELPDARSLLEHLDRQLHCQHQPVIRQRCQLLDTFDWRLHQAGLLLLAHGDGDAWQLELLDHQGQWRAGAPGSRAPRFANELAPGDLQARLTEVCDCRALLVQLETRVSHHRLAVLNEDRKTVLRLSVEDHQDPADGQSLPPGLRLMPVRGYRKESRAVLALLAPLHPQAGPALPLTAACQRQGVQPGDYTSKPTWELDPRTRADAAVGVILRDLLHTLRANEAGAREAIDPEFLHDFRVAVRRTRVVLGQLKRLFPGAAVARFRADFAWLGQATGATRDLDVYLLHFETLQATLPAPMQAHLEALREILRQHQAEAQQALVAVLNGPRYQGLLADWAVFLNSLPDPTGSPGEAAQPILGVARKRIWKAYRRVIQEGRALGPDSAEEAFHELRKSCKKLRYLMEFFQSLFPGPPIKQLIKALKGLQENLGDHQDQTVQAAFLHDLAARLPDTRKHLELLLAMGALVAGLLHQQQASRAAFARRFKAFQAPDHRTLFRTLFHPHQAGLQP